MCVRDETVTYSEDEGPLLFEVSPGFSTKGRFRAAVRHPDGDWVEFARGDLTDGIEDLFIVPVDAELLEECIVLVVGNYSPADIPTGTQISVDYVFRQRGAEIHRSEIRESKAGVVSCSHSYDFEPGA
ncbi:MAG: hypothetical protein ACRELX_06000 [Longimicrobiales bacterium]